MTDFKVGMLTNFVKAARKKSQCDVIKMFLWLVIRQAGIAEAGSVLVYNHCDNKLHLFNDKDFLFELGFLERGKAWKFEFSPFEGIAGIAFVTQERQVANDVAKDPRFAYGGAHHGDIRSIICIPILGREEKQPFGVVSFHNSDPARTFDEATSDIAEMAGQCLGLALDASAIRLSDHHRRTVFIVHGRDSAALYCLKNFLGEHRIEPVVLRDQPRTGAEILSFLDEKIDQCAAGFVLLTPDDEGRLIAPRGAPEEKLQTRVRQNVIFEAGLLCARFRDLGRVCFLKRGEMEIPSDLHGMLFEDFDPDRPDYKRLEDILIEWNIALPATRESYTHNN